MNDEMLSGSEVISNCINIDINSAHGQVSIVVPDVHSIAHQAKGLYLPNPTYPGMLGSRRSGTSMKGTDGDFSAIVTAARCTRHRGEDTWRVNAGVKALMNAITNVAARRRRQCRHTHLRRV